MEIGCTTVGAKNGLQRQKRPMQIDAKGDERQRPAADEDGRKERQ